MSIYFPAFGLNAKYISVRVNETKINTENASNQARFGLDQPHPYRNFFKKKSIFAFVLSQKDARETRLELDGNYDLDVRW